jgi:DNA-binding transcriptional MocR family regulator
MPPLIADLSTRIVANGTATTLLNLQRQEIAARNDMAKRILGEAPRRQYKAAMHLWLQLPDHWRASAFVETAATRGVLIASGEEFMVGRPDKAARHVRLCLGAAANRTKLEQGLTIISELMSETPIETGVMA